MSSHKKGKSQDPKVAVSADTLQELKNLKSSLGLKSMDEVIQSLLHPPSDSSEGDESSSSSEPEDDGGQRKRKRLVRDPLFSFEELSEREGMIEYYTGMTREAVDLVIRRLGEVSWRVFFPLFFPFSSSPLFMSFSCFFFTLLG